MVARTNPTALVGLAVAVVAVVGAVVYGWEFGDAGPVPTALGVLCAALAVVLWLRD